MGVLNASQDQNSTDRDFWPFLGPQRALIGALRTLHVILGKIYDPVVVLFGSGVSKMSW